MTELGGGGVVVIVVLADETDLGGLGALWFIVSSRMMIVTSLLAFSLALRTKSFVPLIKNHLIFP